MIKLTEEQNVILNNYKNNMYIAACPGSGKSTILSYLADKILNDNELNNILLLTFTNKASKSIIKKCSSSDKTRINGGTFHSIGYKLLRKFGDTRTICDENKQRLIIKRLLKTKDKDLIAELYSNIVKSKSEYRINSKQPDDILLKLYNNELARYNLMDFDDLIIETIKLLQTIPNIGITHVLVDELQDTSGSQLDMISAIQSNSKSNIIGVGDGDQNIYEWRASRPENVDDFIKIFNCKIMNMGSNFRSCIKIVEASKKLISNNKKRLQTTIRPNKQDEGLVFKFKCDNYLAEIDYIIKLCRKYYSEKIMILYRNRIYKNHLEFELRKSGIKYYINDALEITDRSSVRVMLSCLRVASMEFDAYDLQYASKGLKGLGIKSCNKLIDDSSKLNITLNNYILAELSNNKKKYLNSIRSIREYFSHNQNKQLNLLANEIEKYFITSFDYQKEMKDFLTDITKDYKISTDSIRQLYNELGLDSSEKENNKEERIELSTIHGAKGLEQEMVIMPWCQQFNPQSGKEYNEEAERRLFYVGTTRAMEKLFLVYSEKEPKFIKELDI